MNNKSYIVGKPIKPMPVMSKEQIEQCKLAVSKYIKTEDLHMAKTITTRTTEKYNSQGNLV